MKTGNLFFVLCLLTLSGCDFFEAHPYDAKISGRTDINEAHISLIEEHLKDKHTFRFAFVSDTQRYYDETEDVVKSINSKNDIDFVIHGGDMADFGTTHEFIMQRDILLKLDMPWVTIIGNHDCLGTGENVYKEVFGQPNYFFQAGNTMIVCLNTNALEYDYSEPVPDFGFLEDLLAHLPQGVERTIVAMHAPPFDEVFNNNLAQVFQLYLKTYPNLMFCINGHQHRLSVTELFEDGVLYYQTPDIKKRQYMLFTIHEEGYEYEVIDF